MAAAGRPAGPAAAQLAQRLRDNWYQTAGDVAAMTQDELEALNVPLKLWAVINDQLSAAASTSKAGQQQADREQQQQQQQQPPPPKQQQQQQQQQQQEGPCADGSVPLASSRSSAGSGVGVGAAASHNGVDLPKGIMQRRMPPSSGQGRRTATPVRHVALLGRQPYGLKDSELTDSLRAELAELERFCTTRFYGQLADPVLPVTFRTVTRHYAMLLLGFAHRVRGVPLEQLSLRTLLPSPGREGVSLLMDFQHWRATERGTAPSSATLPIKAALHVARFLFHQQALQSADSAAASLPGRRQWRMRPYASVEVVQELGQMQRAALRAASKAARVADESRKWLQWDEFLGMVRALRAECAGLTASGKPRSRREVAASLQRYLIVAILSVVPDRQRTLRELEVGRTLLQQDGAWVIKHGPGDYKTGKKYGDRPPLLIAPFIYPELEAFIGTWRAELSPKTSLLFCKPTTGEPMDENSVYYTFKAAALRLTGKATHPHLVRDLIVTHLRSQRTGEAQMEALALYMGHSLSMQRATYDRRTKAQKLTPAVELLQGLAAAAGAAAAAPATGTPPRAAAAAALLG